MSSYRERDDILREMGFSSYDEYTASDWWKIIREEVLKRDVYRCRVRRCSRTATLVQHFTYTRNTMIGSAPFNLISLCGKCHREMEFDGDHKRPLGETQKRTLEMVLGLKIIEGVSCPRIGFWFRNQRAANKQTQLDILEKLKVRYSIGTPIGAI